MSTISTTKESLSMNRKIISISSKHQITIPQKIFDALQFSTEAECSVEDGALVLRPVYIDTEEGFAEFILADLIAEGLSGEELMQKFKTEKKKIRPAIENMIEEAENVASGNGEYYTYDDIFDSEE